MQDRCTDLSSSERMRKLFWVSPESASWSCMMWASSQTFDPKETALHLRKCGLSYLHTNIWPTQNVTHSTTGFGEAYIWQDIGWGLLMAETLSCIAPIQRWRGPCLPQRGRKRLCPPCLTQTLTDPLLGWWMWKGPDETRNPSIEFWCSMAS